MAAKRGVARYEPPGCYRRGPTRDRSEPYMEKLEWLIAECDCRGMVVDVTLTKGEGRLGNAHLSALDKHARALETLTSQLKAWRNWYLDVANEHNIHSRSLSTKFVSFGDARVLRDRVKKVDRKRLVTISYVRDASKDEVRNYLFDVQVPLGPARPAPSFLRHAEAPTLRAIGPGGIGGAEEAGRRGWQGKAEVKMVAKFDVTEG